jgi:hypothetical protein
MAGNSTDATVQIPAMDYSRNNAKQEKEESKTLTKEMSILEL